MEWEITGVGCCANHGTYLYDAFSKGLDDCKRACVEVYSNCGWINYYETKWCSIIQKTSDCSKLSLEATICGSNTPVEVHKYLPRHGNTLAISIQFLFTIKLSRSYSQINNFMYHLKKSRKQQKILKLQKLQRQQKMMTPPPMVTLLDG